MSLQVWEDFLHLGLCGTTERAAVADLVCKHRGKEIDLTGQSGCKWKIVGLDETEFQEKKNLHEEWKKCNPAAYDGMEIVGTLDNTPIGQQLILMLCVKDGTVHGCADGHPQVLSSSLQGLFNEGPHFPTEEVDLPGKFDCKVSKQCVDNPGGEGGRLYYDASYIGHI